jgi:hypothetical protein
MKKTTILSTIVLLLILSSCTHPKAIENEEIMQYLPIIKADYKTIIEKLETLRLGVCGREQYIVIKNRIEGNNDYKMIFRKDDISYSIEETPDSVPTTEIEAIECLFFSEEIQQNATSISYDSPYWYAAIDSNGALFARTKDIKWNIGIYYFKDNEIPYELQEDEIYTEELSDCYWIVIYNMRRDKL